MELEKVPPLYKFGQYKYMVRFQYHERPTMPQANQLRDWCLECFGWEARKWSATPHAYFFEDEADAMLFMLRWNGKIGYMLEETW